jgi:hypothetical protein
MGIQEKGVFQGVGLRGEALTSRLKTQALRSSLTKAFALKQNTACPEHICVACDDREIFLAHLLRLDEQTRLERFGRFSLEDGFFERAVSTSKCNKLA